MKNASYLRFSKRHSAVAVVLTGIALLLGALISVAIGVKPCIVRAFVLG